MVEMRLRAAVAADALLRDAHGGSHDVLRSPNNNSSAWDGYSRGGYERYRMMRITDGIKRDKVILQIIPW